VEALELLLGQFKPQALRHHVLVVLFPVGLFQPEGVLLESQVNYVPVLEIKVFLVVVLFGVVAEEAHSTLVQAVHSVVRGFV
jgi:hypothetical protein